MCMDHKTNCFCGKGLASFNFKDEVMPHEVVTHLYCPECSKNVAFDAGTMVADNGWIIVYDMEVARFMGQKLPTQNITPDYLFDEGYCTWRGMTPTDHIDTVREREELTRLAKSDPKRYLTEIKDWAVRRMARLSEEGWRKAHGRETAAV